jgi:hypothetical protein
VLGRSALTKREASIFRVVAARTSQSPPNLTAPAEAKILAEYDPIVAGAEPVLQDIAKVDAWTYRD